MAGSPSSYRWGVPEAVPTCPASANPIPLGSFLSNVTSVGDNASSSLERILTLGLTIPSLITIRVPSADGTHEEVQDWVLDVSRDANDPLHQRPNDYADPANVRCWIRYR